MLMTFCVTIDISDAVCAGRKLVLGIFRFAREVFFADIIPSMQVKLLRLNADAAPGRVCSRSAAPPLHAPEGESLTALVNQI
jgi:hypothetical protein